MKILGKLIIVIFGFYSTILLASNTVAISYDTGFSQPFMLPATTTTINKQSVPLLVDLGFSVGNADIVLKKGIAKKLHLSGHGPKICGHSQAGKTCYLRTIIPKIKIGTKTYHNIYTYIAQSDWSGGAKYKKMTKGTSYNNGVITYAFLHNYNIDFNFPSQQMTLYNFNENVPDKILILKNRLDFVQQNGVTTTLNVASHKLYLVWDTALMPTLINSRNIPSSDFSSCNQDYSDFVTTQNCYTASSTFLSGQQFLVKSIGLPAKAVINGFVGSDYFNQNRVFIDFSNNYIYIN